jgi:hypothetical protein
MVSAVVPVRAIVGVNESVQLVGTVPVSVPSTQAEMQPAAQVARTADVTVKRAKVPSWVTSNSTCTVPMFVPSVLHSAPVPVPEQQQLASVVAMRTSAWATIVPSDTVTHSFQGFSQQGMQSSSSQQHSLAILPLPAKVSRIFPFTVL